MNRLLKDIDIRLREEQIKGFLKPKIIENALKLQKNNLINYSYLRDRKIELVLPKRNPEDQVAKKSVSINKKKSSVLQEVDDITQNKPIINTVNVEVLYNKIHDKELAKIIT